MDGRGLGKGISGEMLALLEDRIAKSEFDLVAFIMPAEDRFVFLDEERINPVLRGYIGKPYGASIRDIIDRFADSDTHDYLEESFSLRGIELALDEGPVFEFVGHGSLPGGGFTAKKHRMYYSDDSRDIIIYTRLDITESLRFTEERNAVLQSLRVECEERERQVYRSLSVLSHGVRTPLAGISAAAELLTYGAAEERRDDCIKAIRRDAHRIQDMFSNLLTMTELEYGRFKFMPERFDMLTFSARMVEEAAGFLQDTGHHFSADISGIHPCMVSTDAACLEHGLMSIIDNAAKFSPPGSTVEGAIEEISSGNPEIAGYQVTLTDHGCGIPPADLGHVFEPCWFAERAYTDQRYGAGLSLAVAKRLIGLNGGSMEMESVVGEGTTVTVRWFARLANEDDAAGRHRRSDLKGMRILLVEDNLINAEIEGGIIEQHGADVDFAENGEAGYERFLFSPAGYYDAILMDIKMPKMDGLEATRAIRRSAHAQARRIPILAISANTMEDDIERGIEAGVDAYVAKPVDTRQLVNWLLNLVDSRR